jgi:D-sedoheptulose 7-phosphate isomerase
MDIKVAVKDHQQAIDSVIFAQDTVLQITKLMIECLENGGKVLWFGNGGSASEAQHMAAELMVRYKINRQPLASIALTTDSSILTSHCNDYEFATVFARQIEALATTKDMVIGMSTSGTSENVVKALAKAKQMGCISIALVGKNATPVTKLVDLSIQINSLETARIQEAHTFINHLVCEGLDEYYKK